MNLSVKIVEQKQLSMRMDSVRINRSILSKRFVKQFPMLWYVVTIAFIQRMFLSALKYTVTVWGSLIVVVCTDKFLLMHLVKYDLKQETQLLPTCSNC